MKNLTVKTFVAFIALAIAMALLLFVTAGTLDYWQAWVFLVLFFGVTIPITLYLRKNDPALMQRRMSGSGPFSEPGILLKVILSLMSLGFIALLVIPALDHRMHWSYVPLPVVVLGDLVFVIGWFIVFLVFRENSFAMPNIKVEEGQKVISTGPYAVVRHPMYAGSLLYCLGMPFALGSYWGLLAFAIMIPFGVWRLHDEENLLSVSLPGYKEYRARVRWRLIPGIF